MNSINSNLIQDHIHAQIERLAMVIQVEKQCTIEEAIVYTRKFIVEQVKDLMDKELYEEFLNYKIDLDESISMSGSSIHERRTYTILSKIGII